MSNVKIAIMGAGLSGLSCAITLEKHGLEPVIFEERSRVGDRFVNAEILLSILNRPVNDSIAYFAEEHGIFLRPVGHIRRMVLYSENRKAVIEGQLGFSNVRGRHPESFENQLAGQVQSEIVFNSRHSYENLLREFTHVVLATGDAAFAVKLGNYRVDLTATLKGANVTGRFDRYTVRAWLDNRLAPKGYGYLIPFSDREAHIVIAYPDYPENREQDINLLWDAFYRRVCRDLDQVPKITDHFEVTGYVIGLCARPRIGNTFFVGNCFGAIMPLAGFGQFAAMLTGIYAAHDLCGLGDYAELTRPLRRSYENSLALRRAVERMENRKLDLVVRLMNTQLGRWFFNTRNLDPLKAAGYLLRPWTAAGSVRDRFGRNPGPRPSR